MNRIGRLAVVLLGCALAGCSDSPDGATPGRGGEIVLTNGVRVVVASTGAVTLFDGDRPLLATPESAFPTAHVFRELESGSVGIWTFDRRDEQRLAFDRYVGVAQIAGDAIITYARSTDRASDQPPPGEATLRVRAGERPDTTVLRLELTGVAPTSIALPVRCDPEGSFHGFGEQYQSTEQTGETFDLVVSEQGIGRDGSFRDVTGDAHTTYLPMPYWLDARGFGTLVRTDHRVRVDVCATDARVAWIDVIAPDPVELVVFHGPTPRDVVRQLGDEVGRPAAPPDWAFGTWMSIQGGRDAVLAEVNALETAGVPFSAVWSQDWTGVRMNIGGGFGVQYRWNADEQHYPDLAGMIDELHGRGYRFLAYANPFVDPALADHFDAMSASGLLVRDIDGTSPYVFAAPNGESAHPDLTSDEARDYVRGEFREMVRELGIDGWMADFGEWTPFDAVFASGADPQELHNRFPVEWHRVNREAMDAERPDGDWVLFARSGWTGVQRHSMIHWVGDQEATFSPTDGLPTVVPAMINLGLCGIPYVTHDIGGFSGGPSTKELFMRWTELGAFTPVMRTHEGNRRDLNHSWDTDAETTAHFRRFSRIHDALRADLVRVREEARETGMPMVRHVLLEFPEDRAGWLVSDQYLLGDALLVAPVVQEGATSRRVYLPEGATWFHVFTGEEHTGGQHLDVPAPIGSPPVFHRDTDRLDLRTIE